MDAEAFRVKNGLAGRALINSPSLGSTKSGGPITTVDAGLMSAEVNCIRINDNNSPSSCS